MQKQLKKIANARLNHGFNGLTGFHGLQMTSSFSWNFMTRNDFISP